MLFSGRSRREEEGELVRGWIQIVSDFSWSNSTRQEGTYVVED